MPMNARTPWMLCLAALVIASVPVLATEQAATPCTDCHDVDAAALAVSIHGAFACTDCHVGVASPHDEVPEKATCATCHGDVETAMVASVHGKPVPAGLTAPTCVACHGDSHKIAPSSDPSSPVHANRQADTCGACHGNPEFALALGIKVTQPIEAYRASVHGRAVESGGSAASCASCHTAHDILPHGDPASSVSRGKLSATCGQCHPDVAEVYDRSIHGKAAVLGVHESPVCTDCHGEHRIMGPRDAGSALTATNIPIQTCGRCHADLRLAERFGLAADKVPAYEDSYHGLAGRGGKASVAHCGSCHGVHDVLPSSDPASHIHPNNLAATCGACHPGAGQRFAISAVHVLAADSTGTVSYWVRKIYLPLIWLTIGGMLIHNLLDFVYKIRHRHAQRFDSTVEVAERMPLGFRIAHAGVIVSFIALVFTGFALKYPESWWTWPFRLFDAGEDFRAVWHRVAGVVMTLATVGHLAHVAVSARARRRIRQFIPNLHDVRELRMRMAFNLGLSKTPPPPAKVGYIEKSEYLAFMWGTVVMVATGLVLWFQDWSLRNLPGWALDASTAIHFYEAILATLSILVWHFYWVIFDPLVYPVDTTFLTGRPPLSRAEERGEVVEVARATHGGAGRGRGDHGRKDDGRSVTAPETV